MAEPLKPDICVIGAGSGGLSVAAAAAQLGTSVVLIERGKMGGDCLNYGCVPSKAMIAAGKRAHTIRTHEALGVRSTRPQVDFAEVHDHVHRTIAAIAPNDSVERFTGLGVRVIQAEGRFKDDRTVEAGGHEIQARRFVIATGSSPTLPPIEGIEDVPHFTNETGSATCWWWAAAPSAWSWPRPTAGSAPRSPCWRPSRRSARTTRS